MTDLPERLRSLAESLEGDEWGHPLLSQKTCIDAAVEIERLLKLAFIGEHHFPDLTWKKRCEEQQIEINKLRRQIETAPKTLDGTVARPGLFVHGDWGAACIIKVCDGGEYGYTAEISDSEGPQGWVRLDQCYTTPVIQGDSWENISRRTMEHSLKYAMRKIDESTKPDLDKIT